MSRLRSVSVVHPPLFSRMPRQSSLRLGSTKKEHTGVPRQNRVVNWVSQAGEISTRNASNGRLRPVTMSRPASLATAPNATRPCRGSWLPCQSQGYPGRAANCCRAWRSGRGRGGDLGRCSMRRVLGPHRHRHGSLGGLRSMRSPGRCARLAREPVIQLIRTVVKSREVRRLCHPLPTGRLRLRGDR